MKCPRCDCNLQIITEYITESDKYIITRDYYCYKCKSAVVEDFDDCGLFSSEWIDFNV